MPPAWATTSYTLCAEPANGLPLAGFFFGSMNVQLAPLSVLRATPQFVPTKTLFAASGRIEMPNAAGSPTRMEPQSYAAGGVAEAGLLQVVPASVLTSMPDRLPVVRPSYSEVAYTRLLLLRSTSTSQVAIGLWPGRWAQLRPPLVVRYRPPHSLAA
jgi:hypothetical protein